jgi:SAM-dependent methyltransferase
VAEGQATGSRQEPSRTGPRAFSTSGWVLFVASISSSPSIRSAMTNRVGQLSEHMPAATYDRVIANHMLFHVADQLAALRELRRVLKPTGRVLLATNAADHSRRLWDLHAAAARQLGYTPAAPVGARFNLDHLGLVQQVFPEAARRVRSDAFVFPTAEVVLRYVASGVVDAIVDPPADGSHRAPLLALMGEQVELRIYHGQGHWPGTWSEASYREVAERILAWFDTYLDGSPEISSVPHAGS